MPGLFGTDGIRGKANHYPMTPEVAMRAGRALVAALNKTGGSPHILIGKDTRLSGDMIECAVAAGICAAGGNVHLCGVLPTPGIAYLTTTQSMDAGVVISASHNPFADNGIKFFNSEGFKLSMEMEASMDEMIRQRDPEAISASTDVIGSVYYQPGLADSYAEFLTRMLPREDGLQGLCVVLDCSNGATYRVAPKVFKALGASVETICAEPDGKNINEGCGSQDTRRLKEKVEEKQADIGLAFDGDGDRLIAVDAAGQTVTGDQILAICARHLKQAGKLANNRVVSTVMSNVGFHKAMAELGIELIITDVGDRYVLEQMRENGAVIGGEDSGHMIFLDSHTSGDGILTGLQLIRVMRETGRSLSDLAGIMKVYPQVLMNVGIEEKTDIYQIPEIAAAISRVENALDSQGRVLVRYSGTQPLCRVMVEGPDPEQTRRYCEDIVDVIQSRIGR
ncbi:MAG: phosphoglucosamine mutase [Desulfosalsimonas sp.]